MKPVISLAAVAALGLAACSSPKAENTVPAPAPKEIIAEPVDATAAPYEKPAQHMQAMPDRSKDATVAKRSAVRLTRPAGKQKNIVVVRNETAPR
jgi:hypothetical protein